MRQKSIILCLLLVSCIPTLERSSLEFLGLFRFLRSSSSSSALAISYAGSPFTFTQNLAINPIMPTTLGIIVSCTSSPSLPMGLSIDSASCAISGTPTTIQAATNYTITAVSSSATATTDINITVTLSAPSNLVYAGSPFAFSQNAIITSQIPTISGTASACSSSPTLPTGLNISSSCIISGTPTTLQTATTYTITASNSFGSTTAAINITVSLALVQFSFNASSLVDSGGSGLTLNTFGGPTGVNGKDGDASGAYNFNGSSQYLTIASPTGLPTGAAPRTLCLWANPNTLLAPAGYAILATYGTGAASSSFGLYQTNNAGTHQVAISGFGDDLVANYTLPVNTWSHMCGTYDGTTARLYVNGQLLTSGAKSFTTGSSFLYIGVQSTLAQYFSGKLDDVRIYNSALTATQIRQIAVQVPTGLLARYDFNGNPSDVSGNNNSLSSSGSPALNTDRFGITNSAYTFNGATRFSTSAPLTTSIAGNITLSAWIRPTSYAGSNLQVILFNGTGSDGYGILIDHGNSATGCAPNNVFIGLLGSVGYICSTVVPPLNVWSHVSLRATGTNWDLRLNGVSIAALAATTPSTPTTATYIGSDSASNSFTGDIDDVRIYNVALSNSEILALSGYHPMQVSTWNANPVISSLQFYIQADSLSSLATNTTFSSWPDSSGNGNDLTAGINPTYVANIFGSKPAISFTGTEYLTKALFAYTFANYSYFAAFKNEQGGVSNLFLTGYTDSGFPANPLQISSLADMGSFQYAISKNGVGIGNRTSIIPANNDAIITLQSDGALSYAYTYGILGANASPFVVAAYPTGSTLYIGSNPVPGAFFIGKMGDILIFNGQLSSISIYNAPWTDRQIVECYLSSKYNIPLGAGVTCP